MTQLNFCKSCGEKRVKDVKAELEALFEKKELHPNVCGVCCKLILKEELIDDDQAGYNDQNLDQNLGQGEKSTASSDRVDKEMGEIYDSEAAEAREVEVISGAESDQSVDIEKLKQEATDDDSDVSDEGSNYSDEIEIDLKKEFSTVGVDKLVGPLGQRKPYVPRKQIPIDISHLHSEVRDMIDIESVKPNYVSCKTCSKGFKRSAIGIHNFVTHISTHSGGEPISKPYKCPECDYTYKCNSYLKEHMMSHSSEKVLECQFPECEFRFNTKLGLKRHMDRVHLGIKQKPKKKQQHICQICGRVLEYRASLKKHLLLHDDREKSFKCDVCGKCFHDKPNLSRHRVRHQKVKSTTCEICGKGFHIVQELNTHLVTHKDDRNYQCEFCPHTAKRLGNLKAHVRNIHAAYDRDRNKCSYCGLTFVSPGACTKHEKKHQDGGMDLAEVLLKPYQCEKCGYRASKPCRIRMHMRAHTGEKPFQCVHCKKMFGHKSQCTKHLKICKKQF